MAAGLMTFARAFVVSIGIVLCTALTAHALEIPQVPNDIPLVDQTNTLTTGQKSELVGMIAKTQKDTGNQIGILIIPTLEDESLEEYSIKVAREWGIGNEESNNGVLFLVVKEDRLIRIEVGYGLEGALTDIRSGQIIRDRITPEFRKGNYFEGIRSGLTGITTAIAGEVDPNLNTDNSDSSGTPWSSLAFLFFLIPSWLASILGRSKSWWAGGVIGAISGTLIAGGFNFSPLSIAGIAGLTIGGLIFDKIVSSNYKKHAGRGDSPSWWAGGTFLGGGHSGGGGGFGGFGGGGGDF